MTETIHAAVLDSACSKTVSGLSWKEMYLASLPEKKRVKSRYIPVKLPLNLVQEIELLPTNEWTFHA